MPNFSISIEKLSSWVYNSTEEPSILSGNKCILYLKKGWETLALSLLSKPLHTKTMILRKTIQEWITPRTDNCLLLKQHPKSAFFSYKHHYQSEFRRRSTTNPSTNSLTEGIKTNTDTYRSSRTWRANLQVRKIQLHSPFTLQRQMHLGKDEGFYYY